VSELELFLSLRARAQKRAWEILVEEARSRGLLSAVVPLVRRILLGQP